MNCLRIACLSLFCLHAQKPKQLPSAGEIKEYAEKVDTNKTLTVFRYMQTYGHPLNPGKDTLFWTYPTDFPGSVIIYYAAGKIVKIQETARTSGMFCENNYYLKNDKPLFVKTRQVHCSLPNQRAIWFKKTVVCNNTIDCFFRGSYYFADDSCFTYQESGASRWEPHRFNTAGRITPNKFFPWQAARYVAAFGKIPTRKK